MIHLIMVFSAIILSSCSTKGLLSHTLQSRPSHIAAMNLRILDETNDAYFQDEKRETLMSQQLIQRLLDHVYARPSSSSLYSSAKMLTMNDKDFVERSSNIHLSQSYELRYILKRAEPAFSQMIFKKLNMGKQGGDLLPIIELPSLIKRRRLRQTPQAVEGCKAKKKFIICKTNAIRISGNVKEYNLRDKHTNKGFSLSSTYHVKKKNESNLADTSNIHRSHEMPNPMQPSQSWDRKKRSTTSDHTHDERNSHEGKAFLNSDEINRNRSATDTNLAIVDTDYPEENIVTGVVPIKGNSSSNRGQRRRRGRRRQHRQSKDLALWIDERQVKLFSGYTMEIFAIYDGRVMPYILDPNFEKHLPVIPYEVQNVNFTWQAGRKRYYYTFDRLSSQDRNILEDPVVSLPAQGRIPRKPKVFTVNINCTGNASGISGFDIGLLIQTRRGKSLPGTPLRLKLRKECTQPSPDPECDEKCENGGVCDIGRKCQCPEGYMGQYCNTALCYPQCMNGGTCTTPGRCTCPPGYQGRHCEGGICRDKCENGGKCIQKDTCSCPRGYYGNRCEFSKCVIPCVNGGRCRNVNKCRCPHGFAGDHCEIVTGRNVGATALARCSRKCRHGSCKGTTCQCQQGYTGRWCKRRGGSRKPVWL